MIRKNKYIQILKSLYLSTVKNTLDRIYWDRVKEEKDIILLTSMARSGSTFLSQQIRSAGGFRNYHEPFFSEKVKDAYMFKNGLYINPSAKSVEHLGFINKVFDGRIYNEWVASSTYSFRFNKRLIKTIRLNLMIPWVRANFPSIKLIVLMRNPFEVISSILNVNFGDGSVYRDMFFDQEELCSLFPRDLLIAYKNATSPKELIMFQWCIQYSYLFGHLNPSDYKLVVYERLLSNTANEMNEIYDYIQIMRSEKWKRTMHKPSVTTSRNSAIRKSQGSSFSNWRRKWTNDEIVKAVAVLKYFNLDGFYEVDKLPNKSDLYYSCSKIFNS